MSGMASFIFLFPVLAPPSSPAKAGDPVTTVANTSQAHGVLDAPLARGMTSRCDDGHFPTSASALARGPPSVILARSSGLVRLPVLVSRSFIQASLSIGIGMAGSIALYLMTSS